ncbi:MAG: biotin synthase BioB [Acidiferrobacterales bacterium]
MSLNRKEIEKLFNLPFSDLIFKAQGVHRQHFDANTVQVSTLLSIKTGGCSEDCGYCSQSARFDTGVESESLMALEDVIEAATVAKAKGATRFCMGAAWRGPKEKDMGPVTEMIRAVQELGLETCATLGMLKEGQAEQLADAGLDYYNHNLDTASDYYDEVIHTHSQDDRLDTLAKVRKAGMKVCCGGIVGLGESRTQRAGLIAELAALDPQPESVPINLLVKIPGTPLAGNTHASPSLEPLEFVRTIAVARLSLPKSYVRLSAGRQEMPDYLQALCFLAGANSVFYGDKLLTTPNPDTVADMELFKVLGLKTEVSAHAHLEREVAEA